MLELSSRQLQIKLQRKTVFWHAKFPVICYFVIVVVTQNTALIAGLQNLFKIWFHAFSKTYILLLQMIFVKYSWDLVLQDIGFIKIEEPCPIQEGVILLERRAGNNFSISYSLNILWKWHVLNVWKCINTVIARPQKMVATVNCHGFVLIRSCPFAFKATAAGVTWLCKIFLSLSPFLKSKALCLKFKAEGKTAMHHTPLMKAAPSTEGMT